MIKFVLSQWDKNKDRLEEFIRNRSHATRADWDYCDLVTITMDQILNHNPYIDTLIVDSDDIIVANIGSDRGGVKLFIIPFDTSSRPSEDEFLLSYLNYGTSYDTLRRIQYDDSYGDDPEQAIKDYMTLCRDICANIIRPYNNGRHHDDMYDTVTMEGIKNE